MERREQVDGSSSTPEQASVTRTIAYLTGELGAVDCTSRAAELYEAFIAALQKVYGLRSSD